MIEEGKENSVNEEVKEESLPITPLKETKESEEAVLELDNQKEEQELNKFPKIGEDRYIETIGRRKTATCRVRILDLENSKDDFEILVNDREYTQYFLSLELAKIVDSPLRKIRSKNYRVTVKVKGGGLRGQAEAIRLGLARALVKLNPEWRIKFRKAGYLTRDPREVERKKYGRRKARRREQWHKR